jgi:uncharacterized protein (TIGR03663 family)
MSNTHIGSFDKRDSFFWFALLIAFIGVILRFTLLDLRPLHHDESIHVMFGRYFFDWPNQNFYKYNPEYHGPLLYNALRFVYDTFGDYEWSARGLMATLGVFLLTLPFLLRKYLHDAVFITLVCFLSLSPTLIYWARFVREDMFVLAGMGMMLYGVLGAKPSTKSLWVLLGIVFQYASKENSYVTMAMFWGYFVSEWIAKKVIDKKSEPFPLSLLAPLPFAFVILMKFGIQNEGTALVVKNRYFMDFAAAIGGLLLAVDCFRNSWKKYSDETSSLVVKLFSHIANYRVQFLSSFVVAAFLFIYLFSAGFRYPEGIVDGLYYKGITYWIEKHNIERIKGPFLFHFYQLSWYEFTFMLLAIIQAIYFYKKSFSFIKWSSIVIFLVAIAAFVIGKPAVDQPWVEPSFYLWKKFKAKDFFDVAGVIILLFHPMLVTLQHWLRKEWNLAFWGYFFAATFFTYCYLGEKVPWLSTYPLVGGLIYLSVYFNQEIKNGNLLALFQSVRFGKIIGLIGWTLLIVALVFIVEDIARFKTIYSDSSFSLKTILDTHQILLILGLLFLFTDYIDSKFELLCKVNFFTTVLVLASLFMLRASYLTNFEFKYRELGYISQVHTTQATLQLANKIRNEILTAPEGLKPSVLVVGDGVWPLTWYFRDLPTYKFSATDSEKQGFDYIFQDEKEAVPAGFNSSKLPLRGWWVPDFSQMTFRRFLVNSLTLRPWGGNGFSNITFAQKVPTK